MKKLLFLLFVIAGTGYLLTQTACEKDPSIDDCSVKQPLLTPVFKASVSVVYSDFKPYSDSIYFTIYQKLCNGEKKDLHSGTGITDSLGIWYPPNPFFSYSFDHKLDMVFVHFRTGKNKDGKYSELEKYWGYDAAKKDTIDARVSIWLHFED